MPRDYFPRPEGQALAFTANFSHKINADPQLYHLSPQRAAEYAALQLAYAQAYQASFNPATRGESTNAARRRARELVEADTRRIGRMIGAAPDLTAQQKLDLGLRVRRPPRRIPRPSTAPRMCVSGMIGQTLTIDLFDTDSGKRRKPTGVFSAVIFWHAGDQPPATREEWKLALQTPRTRCRVELPVVLPPGTKVWLSAYWRNNRGHGPTCAAIYTYLGYAAPRMPVITKAAA
jgi:hypothetical protein